MLRNKDLVWIVVIFGFASCYFHKIPSSDFDCSGRPNGFYASSTSCKEFYMCLAAQSFISECGNDMHFNPVTHYCEASWVAGCHVTTHIAPVVVTTVSAGGNPDHSSGLICNRNSDGEYFKDPNDCSSYYICDHDNFIQRQCPPTLVFNPVTWNCDFKSHVPDCQ